VLLQGWRGEVGLCRGGRLLLQFRLWSGDSVSSSYCMTSEGKGGVSVFKKTKRINSAENIKLGKMAMLVLG